MNNKVVPLISFCVLTFLFFNSHSIFSQDSLNLCFFPSYKNVGFRSPLDIPLFLAGNFAEIRPNHFHGGIDIKTESVEGKNIYSIARGFVSRIKISSKGYGKALYIEHSNGYTSVYGHLQRYSDKIEGYLKKQQYKKETFEIELYPGRNELMVDSGEIVAFSGNTGGSSGPHLHFEIRDSKTEWGMNPLLFGFEIKDNIPPNIKVLGIYPISDSSSVNGKNKPVLLGAFKANGHYRVATKSPLNVKGAIGFGIEVNDNMNGTGNVCGIFSIELLVDETTIYYHDVEKVPYDDTRYINSHIDYELCKTKGRNIQRSFLQPNNKLGIYKNVKNKGIVFFNDNIKHQVKYIVKDSYGNISTLEFVVQSHPFKEILPYQPLAEDSLVSELDSLSCEEDSLQGISLQKDTINSEPDTFGISIDSIPPKFNFFKYNEYNSFETGDVIIGLPKNILYDNLMFEYSIGTRIKGGISPVHRIHQPFVPLHSYMTISIKTDSLQKEYFSKVFIASLNGSYPVAEGGTYQEGFVTTKSRSFGSYTVMIDTIPPGIKPVSVNGSRDKLIFRIGDNLSGIKSYRGTIDDKWVLIEYDYKTGLLIHTFDDSRIQKGKHAFQLTVTDDRGNSSIYKTNITR